jgi:predicted O-methyltransferase YrrM
MRPLGNWLPWDIRDQLSLDDTEMEDYFSPATTLKNIHVQHCRVVPDRFRLLMDCLPTNSICCEVGTDTGAFAKTILELSKPSELHLIDISFNNLKRADFSSAIASETVMLHEADSVVALNKFPNGYFDWIYIDGNHSYDGVSRDINTAKHKIKPTGMLAFNDYIFWSHRELMCYGVMQAVNEFCLKEAWEIVYLALNGEGVNDVVLTKIP